MADIADADLPVFPFKVNWKDGIAERLEWKTDILADTAGNEQRRSLRLHPRRDFEATITVWDKERSFLDLWLHRMVGTECMFPLWHDSVRATQAAAQGQKTVWVDTSGLEFTEGSYALLRGFTAMQFERILIAEVYSDRLVAVDDLVSNWPQGTRVEPLVRGWMSEQTRTRLASSRASETQAEFQTTRAQLYSEGVDSADQYLGLPVLNQAPNRSDALDVQHIWDFKETDSQTGRRYRKSEEGRADTSQKHSWFLRGRSAKSAFRSLLYRLKGALGAVWVPTFNDDISLAQNSAPGATSIYIEEIGFAYTGGPTSGREHIAIQTNTGWLYRRVTGTAAAPAGQERLVLDSPISAGLTRASVRRISWMDTARLENDRIEFKHVNAADGISTVSSIFRSFRNDRVAPAILAVPIPEATKRAWPCDGRPEEPFDGWLWEWVWRCNQLGDGYPMGFIAITSKVGGGGGSGTGSTFGSVERGRRELGGGVFEYYNRVSYVPAEGEYITTFDASQEITPTDPRNSATYMQLGRHWTWADPVLYVTKETTTGFAVDTAVYTIDGLPL